MKAGVLQFGVGHAQLSPEEETIWPLGQDEAQKKNEGRRNAATEESLSRNMT